MAVAICRRRFVPPTADDAELPQQASRRKPTRQQLPLGPAAELQQRTPYW